MRTQMCHFKKEKKGALEEADACSCSCQFLRRSVTAAQATTAAAVASAQFGMGL
jgi:hypothetical protein